MNRVILSGRTTSDAKVNDAITVARYSLAVDRKFKKDGEPTADFINCVSFGKQAEFINKYVTKGTKVIVEGRIQTGSYEKNGVKVNTTDIVVDSIEFAESKSSSQNAPIVKEDNDFMSIPDTLEDELPFA